MEFIPLDMFWSRLERSWLKEEWYLTFLKVNQPLPIFINFPVDCLQKIENVTEIKLQ